MVEEKEKMEKRPLRVAVITANNEATVIMAAIVIEKERLTKKFYFDVKNNVFIVDPKKICELDLKEFDRLYVCGLRTEIIGEHIFLKFLIKNHKKIYLWYNEKNVEQSARAILGGLGIKKLIIGKSLQEYATYNDSGKKIINLKIEAMINALDAIRYPRKYKSNSISEKFKKAIYVAKLNDQYFSSKENPIFTNEILVELLKELVTKDKSLLVFESLLEYQTIFENHEKAKYIDLEHPLFGQMKIIKPASEDALLDRNLLFDVWLKNGVSAVAIKIFDSGKKDLFEICLKKEVADSIIWENIPVEKISDQRYRLKGKLIFQEADSISALKKN